MHEVTGENDRTYRIIQYLMIGALFILTAASILTLFRGIWVELWFLSMCAFIFTSGLFLYYNKISEWIVFVEKDYREYYDLKKRSRDNGRFSTIVATVGLAAFIIWHILYSNVEWVLVAFMCIMAVSIWAWMHFRTDSYVMYPQKRTHEGKELVNV